MEQPKPKHIPVPVRIVVALVVLGLIAFAGTRLAGRLRPGQDEPVRASGTVEARTVEVASEVMGVVTERPIEEGQTVRPGQLIAVISSQVNTAQVSQAEAASQQARELLRKAEEAVALQRGTTSGDIARARAATDTALAKYRDVAAGSRPQEVSAAAAAARQTGAAVEVAAATLAQLEAGLRPEEIRQAEANYRAAQGAVEAARAQLADLEAGSRTEDIRQAQAVVEKAQSALTKAQKDHARVAQLVGQGAAASQQLDASDAALQAAQADLKAAQERVALLRAGSRTDQIVAARAALKQAQEKQQAAGEALALARKGPRYEDIRKARAALAQARAARDAALAQLALVQAGPRKGTRETAGSQVNEARAALRLAEENQRQVTLREAEVDTARAGLAQAEAAVEAAKATLAKFRLVASVAGLVDDAHVRVGETVKPGTSVVTLVDLGDTWVTVYVPETRLGAIRVGDPVQVTVDGVPGVTFAGTVRRVASEAEFTPKNVQTTEERARMVFQVEVSVDNADGKLKPGMPADALFAAPGTPSR